MQIDVPVRSPDRIVPEPDVCPECQGRGWKVVPDGGAGTARPCECRKDSRAAELLDRAGIPEIYRGCKLSSFVTGDPKSTGYSVLEKARRVSEDYVEQFYDPIADRFRHTGLIFVGPPGTGKTHLAVAILMELIRRYQVRGRFVIFTSFVQQILSTFDERSPESQHELLEPVKRAQLLVFDELGARKPSEWVTDILYDIVNTRYVRRLPTIFTTNYRLPEPESDSSASGTAGSPRRRTNEEFAGSDATVSQIDSSIEDHKRRVPTERFGPLRDRISDALVSRVFEMAQPVVLFGAKDHRTEIKKHRHRLGR